jgi:hypothetical protein
MEQTSWVHKLGADKYGPWNWRETGVCASTYVNAILRHLNAWRDGESLDPESGITHLAHIACSANILMDAEVCGKLQDDRNKRPTNDETEEGSLVVGELLTVSEFADILKWVRGEDEEPPTKHVGGGESYEDFWGPLDEDTVPEYRVLKEGEFIQEGDEFFDEQVGEWKETSIVKAMEIEVEPIDLYRRKITDCDLKEESPIDDECKCGHRKVYHWLYGYICEDCDIKYPDPQP